MAAAPKSRAAGSGRARLAVLAASLALVPAAATAQPPLFAFVQISDIEADDPIEVDRFARVLEAIAAAGGAAAADAIASTCASSAGLTVFQPA